MYYSSKTTKPFHNFDAHIEYYQDIEMLVSGDTPIAMFRRRYVSRVKILLVARSFNASAERVTHFTKWINEHGIDYQTVIEVPADLMPYQNFRRNLFIVRGIGSATLGLMFNEGLQ